MSDAYRDLVESLRTSVVQPADGGEATRQRILRDLPRVKRPVRRTRTWLLLAAAFLVSTAFALYIASPAARDAERRTEPASSRVAPDLPKPQPVTAVADASAPSSEWQPEAAVREHSVSPTRVPARAARPPRRATPAVKAPAPPLETSRSTPPTQDAGASSSVLPEQRRMLYIEAHRQHFRGSPEQALAAWDAFLATAPAGQVLLEARYNRAVTLLRLGRRSEAAAALAAFARGEHGGFRQREAQQLLEQLAH